jgi:radical SAM protein with 4Fe4S-binding SPASM domain
MPFLTLPEKSRSFLMKNTMETNKKFTPLPFPERITLELTNRCNLNCIFCPRRIMAKHQGFLNVDLAKKLIDEAAEHCPIAVVPFFRGEPLLHPEWDTILSNIKQKKLGPIQITTNATVMDEAVAAKLIDLEIDFISFSLDTLCVEKYEQARRGANYVKVTENIFRLLELKAKAGGKTPEIQISAIDIPQYKAGMTDFINFWLPKVDRVRVYIEHSQDGHPGSIAEPLPVFKKRLPCRKVFTDMVIYWDGEVALCNHDWTRQKPYLIANLNNVSISDAWNSPEYNKIRRYHQLGQLDHEPLCKYCDHWKMYYLPNGILGEVYTHPTSA